jgi:hypothetical protein
MLTCLPQSLCSWNYRLLGATAGEVPISFNFFTEQGAITYGAREMTVRKHGPLSGHWTLESNDQIEIDATKALTRRFHLQSTSLQFDLVAQTPFTRSFDILLNKQPVGTISPVHLMTRRATIDCSPAIPELDQIFAFWLVALSWRRAAQQHSASPP